jgi:predicted secreted protein
MTTSAKSVHGTTLKRDGNLVAELTNIGGVEIKVDTIDVTSHDSASGYKEWIGGLKEAGEVAIEGNFIPGDTSGQIGLHTDMVAGTLQAFIITFPAALATTWTFDAIVSRFKINDAKAGNEAASFSATLKISGAPTLGITASADATTIAVSVGTLVPAWDADKYDYVDAVVTATANLTFTVTHATAATITLHNGFNGTTSSLTTGVASSAQTLGAADTITEFVITCTVTGKTPKVYTIDVARAAA